MITLRVINGKIGSITAIGDSSAVLCCFHSRHISRIGVPDAGSMEGVGVWGRVETNCGVNYVAMISVHSHFRNKRFKR